jgi:hypothetical protein
MLGLNQFIIFLVSYLTLIKLESGIAVKYQDLLSLDLFLSQGLNLPPPVFSKCVIEHYSFGKHDSLRKSLRVDQTEARHHAHSERLGAGK